MQAAFALEGMRAEAGLSRVAWLRLTVHRAALIAHADGARLFRMPETLADAETTAVGSALTMNACRLETEIECGRCFPGDEVFCPFAYHP